MTTSGFSLSVKVKVTKTFGATVRGWNMKSFDGGLCQLPQGWTGKVSATIIFDSTVDEFTDQGLFAKVKGKRNIAFIGFTTDGDVFGGFYSVAVTEQDKNFYDPDMFVFSFESHGRCETPQRFVVNERVKGRTYVAFRTNNSNGFVALWVDNDFGGFFLGNEKSDSNCKNISGGFLGLEDTTLSGQNNTYYPNNRQFHHCSRLVAVQLS